MANQGDINLARELQAEFGRSKPSKRTGHRVRGGGGGGGRVNFRTLQDFQYHNQHPSQLGQRTESDAFHQGRSRSSVQGGTPPTTRPYRTPFQGQLVTNDSPEADMFFHHPEPPRPSMPPTVTQTLTPSIPIVQLQRPGGQASSLGSVAYPSNSISQNGRGALGMPLYQTTNQLPSKERHDAAQPTSTASNKRTVFPYANKAEEQEDIEMGDADSLPAAAPKPKTTNHSKGLAGSIWNPANENDRSYSTGSSQASIRTRSDTSSSTQAVKIVTSGISKGPGLQASR